MIELELSVQLLTGLSTAVYAFVVAGTSTMTPVRATAGIIGLAPLLSWIVVPPFLGVADLSLPLVARRPAVLLVGIAILLRYLPLRTGRMGAGGTRAAAVAGALLFWAGVSLSAANWIVAVATLLPAAVSAAAPIRKAAESSDEARRPNRDHTDSER